MYIALSIINRHTFTIIYNFYKYIVYRLLKCNLIVITKSKLLKYKYDFFNT